MPFRAAAWAATALLSASGIRAQLQGGDVILLTHAALTHLRGGTATAVQPVGAALPTNWGPGSIEWIPASHTCLAAAGFPPFSVHVLDFSSSVAAPSAAIVGQGIGGGRGLDVVEGGNGMLLLQESGSGGRISVLDAPVTAGAAIAPVPWADSLVPGSADWLVSVDPVTAIHGGFTDAWIVNRGGTAATSTQLSLGNLLYSARDADRDPATGDLYVCVENPGGVLRIPAAGAPAIVLGPADVTAAQDCAFDAATSTLYVVAAGGISIQGTAFGVQAGNDNAVLGLNLALGHPAGLFAVGPPGGHGNSGFFANIAVVGDPTPSAAAVNHSGIGCAGSGGQPFTLGSFGLPVIGTTFTLTLAHGRPNAGAWIFAALSPAPAPVPIHGSCILHLDPSSLVAFYGSGANPVFSLSLDAVGSASLPVALPILPSLLGQQVALQGAALDSGCACGFVVSQGVQILIG